MRAILVEDGRCVLGEVERPSPGPGEVRIDVKAAGINRADLVQKAGRYPPPSGASTILGLEVSGVIGAVGPGVDGWRTGEPCCALLGGGGYAEHVVVDARHVLPRPRGFDHVRAAAVPEVWATAWLNLMHEGGLRGHPRAGVLVHAGASGVGTAAVQLANVAGHDVFVTVGSAEKLEACRALGATGGANRHEGPWTPKVRAWREAGVDVVLDPVGAAYLAHDLDVLATDGRLVLIGLMGGRAAEIDLGRVLVKRLHLVGSTLRSRSADFKAALVQELREHVWDGLADGTYEAIVDRTFPLEEAEAAHALLDSNATIGKLVLQVQASPH